MIYLQYDYEFKEKIVRVIWVGKHVHDKIDRYFESNDYIVLAELAMNSGRQPGVEEIMDGNMPSGDRVLIDNEAFQDIFDKLFNNGWPQIEFE